MSWCSISLLVIALTATAIAQGVPDRPASDLELYAVHCATCHGERGRGDGVAGRFLTPKPRDLRGPLAYVSGSRGRPRAEDIRRTLQDGLPGTSMLAFGHLGDDALQRLTGVVLHFQALGAEDRFRDAAKSPEVLAKWIEEDLNPGPPLPVGASPERASAERGRLLFATGCASCHGATGSGLILQDLRDARGHAVVPRPLEQGIFKWDRDATDLHRLVRLGLPGRAMPGIPESVWTDAEVSDLVAYVQAITPRTHRSLHLTHRRNAQVPFRPGPVPSGPADPRFDGAAELSIPLAPFDATKPAPDRLVMHLFHDGELIHTRVRWADPTRSSDPAFPPDGLAARVTNFAEPPVLPIPGIPLPLDRALWLAGSMPRAEDAVFDGHDPRFQNPDEVCKSPIGPEHTGRATWVSGVWTLVQSIKPDRGGEVVRGGHLFASWAVFDGAFARGPMPVAFSNWNRLDFE